LYCCSSVFACLNPSILTLVCFFNSLFSCNGSLYMPTPPDQAAPRRGRRRHRKQSSSQHNLLVHSLESITSLPFGILIYSFRLSTSCSILSIFSSSSLLKLQSAVSIVPLLLLYCSTARYILYNALGNGSSLSNTALSIFSYVSRKKLCCYFSLASLATSANYCPNFVLQAILLTFIFAVNLLLLLDAKTSRTCCLSLDSRFSGIIRLCVLVSRSFFHVSVSLYYNLGSL